MQDFEKFLDLRQTGPRCLATQSYGLNYPMEIACHAGCQFPISSEHCGDGCNCAALVGKQHEKLLAHEILECRKRHVASCLLAHPLQQMESTLVDDAFRQANIEQGSDRRFARSSLINPSLQLIQSSRHESLV